MEAAFLTHWFSGQFIHALCWTLIHSLWIGLLTAGIAGGLLIATQKSTAQLRYNLLCSTLLAFVLLMAFVFYRELTASPSSQFTSTPPIFSTRSLAIAPLTGGATTDSSTVNWFVDCINRESNWIFAIWLILFVVKSIKLVSGLYYVHRIRYHKVHSIRAEWTDKVRSFSQSLGIRQSVSLLQSELVSVPVTVGLLKPVILLPMGLVLQLPPEQIDTILWHELAHIWRRDYLVNLLQSLVDTVFFFNPGLLWLSSLIRDERELCCDDIVLAHTSGKTNYVEALLACQLNALPQADSVLAMGLGSHQLVDRLRRIVTEENKRLSLVEKFTLLVGLLLFSAFSVLPSSKKEAAQRETSVKKTASSKARTMSPAIAQPLERAKAMEQKPPVALKTTPIQVASLRPTPVVDTLPVSKLGQATPAAGQAMQFTSILFVNTNHDMANRELVVRDDRNNQYRLKVANNQLVALVINGASIPASALNMHLHLLHQIDQALLEKRQLKQEAVAVWKAKAETERQQQIQWQKEAQLRKLDNRQQESAIDTTTRKKPGKAGSVKPEDKKKYLTGMLGDTLAKKQSWQPKKMPPMPDITNDQRRVRGVIAALLQYKIVTDQSAVDWFGLSDSELVVNGIRQSGELHKKLKNEYGIRPQYGLYYGPVNMVGTGVFLDKTDL